MYGSMLLHFQNPQLEDISLVLFRNGALARNTLSQVFDDKI